MLPLLRTGSIPSPPPASWWGSLHYSECSPTPCIIWNVPVNGLPSLGLISVFLALNSRTPLLSKSSLPRWRLMVGGCFNMPYAFEHFE